MSEGSTRRISSELFLSTFGAGLGLTEAWVTDRLTRVLEEQLTPAGGSFYREGDAPSFYYFVREGRVRLTREGRAAWTHVGPCAFGLSDALLERPRGRSAQTTTEVSAMRVPADAWIELLEDSFDLARAAVIRSARVVGALEERLWVTAAPPPARAVADRSAGPLDVLERLAVLMDVPLLRSAGVQILSDLATASDEVTFEPGQTLLERGATGKVVLVMMQGEAEMWREAPRVALQVGPGAVLGGTRALFEPPVAWQARARSRVRALTFRSDDWFDLLEEHFEVVRSTLATLALQREQLVEATSHPGGLHERDAPPM